MAKFKKGDKIKRIFKNANREERGIILDNYHGPNDSEYYHILWNSGVVEIKLASDADLTMDFDLPQGAANSIGSFNKCNHQWKTYVGFTESYEYCELCNAKKDLTY
jgi:hypothetical protein